MTSFLVASLPSHHKSLDAVEFMQKNDFFFHISSNFQFLNMLTSSEGMGDRFADEFKLGDEEKQLIQRFAAVEVKEEVDSDVEHQLKNNVDATGVKEEVESDVEQEDVRATEEGGTSGTEASASQSQSTLSSQVQPAVVPSTVTVQGVEEEAGLEMKEHGGQNSLGEKEEDEQRMERGDGREMAEDDLLEPANADNSMMSIDPIHNDDSLAFDAFLDDFPEQDSVHSANYTEPVAKEEKDTMTLETIGEFEEEVDDEDIKDNENMEEFEDEEEELVEEQEHEDNEMKADAEEQMDENMDDEDLEEVEGDSDEGENEDVSSDEESQKELQKKTTNGRDTANGNPVGRLLFTCFVKNCSFSFKTMEELEEHLKKHTGKQEFFCDVCKNDFPSKTSAIVHIQERQKKECCACGKKFSKSRDFLRHLRCHTEEKTFVCKTCGKRCTRAGVLKLHMKTHTGEKPFSCGLCKKRFTQKTNLKRHERTHTGEKPYECSQCGFKSNNSSHLKDHMRIHTGEKPFSCGQCKKRFTQRTHLKIHEVTHTGEKPHECSHCGRKFTHRSALNSHMRIHTGQKPFSCEKCDKKFTQSHHLKEHMKRIHKS